MNVLPELSVDVGKFELDKLCVLPKLTKGIRKALVGESPNFFPISF